MGWRVDELDVAKFWVSCAYLALWLPYAFIDRPMFLYHYFPALAIGSIGLAMECSGMQKTEKSALVWIAACGIAFLWVAPLTYGIGLEAAGLSRAMLLKNWP